MSTPERGALPDLRVSGVRLIACDPGEAGSSGLQRAGWFEGRDEVGLAVERAAALEGFGQRWVEYGVLERAYAQARPQDFALLVERYRHTAVAPKRYTASSFLGRALGEVQHPGGSGVPVRPGDRAVVVQLEDLVVVPAPAPEWSADQSWASLEAAGVGMDYVPGSTE